MKWIVEISREKDLTINLHHVMDFSSVQMFEAVMLNTGAVVHSYGGVSGRSNQNKGALMDEREISYCHTK